MASLPLESSSLRATQIAMLEKMLHLNQDGPADLTLATRAEQIVWKALVLDAKAQSIVSSVLRVNDLLRCGITIHLLITANRAALSDVPVVYFVEPTRANVVAILDDLRHEKYDDFYVNFTSSIGRELLEEFAKEVSLLGKSHKIKQVYDQYLDYIVTESDLFSLDYANTFTTFNHPATAEDEIHHLAETLANGLLSLVLTLGNVPIIRCQRNGPAELVAIQLDAKLRDYLSNTKMINSIQQRSVLVLVDRNIDLLSMFSHSWIYQCMISDVFELRRNTITIKDGSNGTKNYDIDPKDFFWNKNSQLPFPDVVENANHELELYKKEAMELTSKTGITSLNDIDLDLDNNNDTAKIQQAVDKLPELTSRKATLDMHMDVLASLLKELESKSLDKFFEFEQNYNNPKIEQEFLQLMDETSSKKDNTTDKLRTFIILYLLLDLSESFVTRVKGKLIELGVNIDALKYIEKFKEMSKTVSFSQLESDSNFNNDLNVKNNNSALFNNLSSRLYGLTEGRIGEGLSSLTTGLKKLLPMKKNLPITNIVESIMDPTSSNNNTMQITDDYLYLDPKLRGGHSKPPKRQKYSEGIVFVVGGGNYVEYQNLQELVEESDNIDKVIYGSSGIVTAKEFLEECRKLGS